MATEQSVSYRNSHFLYMCDARTSSVRHRKQGWLSGPQVSSLEHPAGLYTYRPPFYSISDSLRRGASAAQVINKNDLRVDMISENPKHTELGDGRSYG